MNDKKGLKNNNQTKVFLQQYSNNLHARIRDIERNEKSLLEEKIMKLENLRNQVEAAVASKKSEIKKLSLSIAIALLVDILSGVVIILYPFGMITIIMILDIILTNINVFSHLEHLGVISKFIKNNDINKINNSINEKNELLKDVKLTIKEIEKVIEKNKNIISEIDKETKKTIISENPKIESENELEKGRQLTKKIK